MTIPTHHRSIAPTGLLLVLSAGLLAGCLARPYDSGVNTSLERLTAVRAAAAARPPAANSDASKPIADSGGFDIERYARDLQALLEGDVPTPKPPASVHAAPPEPEPAIEAVQVADTSEITLDVSEPDDAPAGPSTATSSSESPVPSLDARIATSAAELRSLLQQRSVGSLDPLRDEAIAAVLDVLTESPMSAANDNLAPAEREALTALREFISGLFAWSAGSEAADPADLARDLADRMAIAGGLRIREAVLCTRVQGFGRFTPLGSTTFLAGRPHRLFLYTEIERFSRRAIVATESDSAEWAVEISQELNLWHDAPTPILAWRRPEERVVETFRGARRDFYLVHTIELPRTLTVGAYMLKVIVRDRVSGSQAEAVIPIRVVADPGLVNATR